MSRKKFKKEELIDLLVKKASGFYYDEEQLEFEKSSSSKNKSITLNIEKNANSIDNDGVLCTKNVKNNGKSAENENLLTNTIKSKISLKAEKNIKIKNLKKVGRVESEIKTFDDSIEVSGRDEGSFEEQNDLILVKKKISKHFVPPDMIAIKILFEIFDKKVENGEIENMSDEELFKLKSKLLEELKNENSQS